MILTLSNLIASYKADQYSTYASLSFKVRRDRDRYLARIEQDYGDYLINNINRRTLRTWYNRWTMGNKTAVGRAFFSQLRSLFLYGFGYLEDSECLRLCTIVERMKLESTVARTVRMTSDQAKAIRVLAHEYGYPSIALAQAFQYELLMRQKDVIGEWIPKAEDKQKIGSEERGNFVWFGGLRWEEIDDNLILRHPTTSRERQIHVDLTKAPMVIEELGLLPTYHPQYHSQTRQAKMLCLPVSGPIIICESTAWPWLVAQFRRKWRMIADDAGVPASVRNMDSRAGAKMVRLVGRDFRDFERKRPGQLPYT